MPDFATLPPGERALFFQQYQHGHVVDPVIVEKDFWVCWLLGRIFVQPDLGGQVGFKGGTSLSKVFGAIARFSEDIDFGISPEVLGWPEEKLDGVSKNAWTERVRPELEANCARHVAEYWLPRLETSVQSVIGPAKTGDPWIGYHLDEAQSFPCSHLYLSRGATSRRCLHCALGQSRVWFAQRSTPHRATFNCSHGRHSLAGRLP